MSNFDLEKKCEVCESPIPDDYGNMLCTECYVRADEAKKQKEYAKEHEVNVEVKVDVKTEITEAQTKTEPTFSGISDPNYQENPEAPDKEQVSTNVELFKKNGVMLWKPTRTMYSFVRDHCRKRGMSHIQYPKYVWLPKVVDVGCGCGVGSNAISEAADFVWGIDKNELSARFAKECFTRTKNNFYYHPQVTFDHLDVMLDTREYMKFDVVVAIEIIEHIYDARGFVQRLIKNFAKKNKNGQWDLESPTEFFISSPNRNNKSIRKDRPANVFHVREWKSGELYKLLSDYFNQIEIFNSAGVPIPKEEYETTLHTPLLFKTWHPK